MAQNVMAAYCRLSRDKSEEGNYSISIDNQQAIMDEYAGKHGLTLSVKPYVDDGYTGMNYNRPGFIELMEDCRAGKINGIIVKDLSRLGRKLYQTLAYAQETFPEEGIRFISIQEGYDSNIPETAHMSLLLCATGMINEQHCIQTAIKTKEALRTRAKERKFIGSKAPYGYAIDPENKYHLVIDPEAAEIVRRVFSLACQGHGSKSIAGIMRREGVPNPTAYINAKNPKHHEKSEYWSKPHDWHASSISTMLNNYAYLGHLFYGRRGKVALRVDKVRRQDETTWIKSYDTHDPIIEQKTWDLAHEVLSRRTKSCHNAPKQIFAGLLKCSDCGYSLSYVNKTYSKKENPNDNGNYKCSTYNVKGKDYCTIHYISYNDLYREVLTEIREMAALAVKNRDWFMQELVKSSDGQAKTRKKGDKARVAQIDKEIAKLERRVNTLYDDRDDGTITKERFKQMYDEAETRITVLKQEHLTLTENLAKAVESETNATNFLDLIAEYDDLQELDASTLNRLIKHIIVGNKVHLGGKKYAQDIIIQFRNIGAITLGN
jgi:DNA invertase Pin-like site-specific DNA recombinase